MASSSAELFSLNKQEYVSEDICEEKWLKGILCKIRVSDKLPTGSVVYDIKECSC